MADIKIEEGEFYTFINKTKQYIELASGYIPEELNETGRALGKYIEEKQLLRGLMLERKAYYDFYISNRFRNQEEAASAYKKYISIKNNIDSIKKGELT